MVHQHLVYVLHTVFPWEDLPQELGFGSGMTCWRRLLDWQAAGVWDKLHLAVLIRLREHDQTDWSRASIDGASVASPRGLETGLNPTDRGKLGSKWHTVVDTRGVPLAITVTGANRHDSIAFESTLDAIPAVPGLDRRPRKRPGKLHADKGYDYARCRHYLRKRGITAHCPQRHRKQRPPGPAPLGRRANTILVRRFRKATDPFRTQARHPQGAALNRSCGYNLTLRR